jgi:hypothetical protein
VSLIDVLLSKDRTGFRKVMVNGREYKAEKKHCQSNNLGDN